MAGALGPAAAAAGDFSGPIRLADSVLAARNYTGTARPRQGEWLGRPSPLQAPQPLSHPHPVASSHPLTVLRWNLLPCDLSLPLPQADGDRRTHPTLGPRGSVLGSSHTPLFLPHGLDPEAGGTLPSRLQPILLLDPSVSHAPLLTGERCCFSWEGSGSLNPPRSKPGEGTHPSSPLSCASPC